KRMGLSWTAECRDPHSVTASDVAGVKRVVSFGPATDLPTAEAWGLGDVESQVMGLIATMLGGKAAGPATAAPVPRPPTKKALTAKVGRETAGRRGKGVTTIFDISLSA